MRYSKLAENSVSGTIRVLTKFRWKNLIELRIWNNQWQNQFHVFTVLNRKQRKSGKDIKYSDTDPFFARDIQIRENGHVISLDIKYNRTHFSGLHQHEPALYGPDLPSGLPRQPPHPLVGSGVPPSQPLVQLWPLHPPPLRIWVSSAARWDWVFLLCLFRNI